MTNAYFGGKRTKAATIIYRTGDPVSITRADGTATTNQYGKVTDGDRQFITEGDEHARRIYAQEGDKPSDELVQGGRLDRDRPNIAFKYDTEAQEGDRIEFPDGKTYVLDERMNRDAYVMFRSTLLTE